MQKRFLPLVWAFTLLILSAQGAVSASAASYVVAPLQVNGPDGYSYLEKAIPPMMSSRLFWEGRYEPVADQDAAVQSPAPKNNADADKLRALYGADYVVFGTVGVVGENASLDITVLDAEGKSWKKSAQSPVNNLIGGVQQITSAISSEVFQRPAVGNAPTRTVAPMNPAFVVNENQPNTVYMNPQIRYQGMESDRVRSQRLEIESRGMAIADLTGDGRNEIILITENEIRAYRMEGGRMEQLGLFKMPTMLDPLQVRTIKQGDRQIIVVPCWDTSSRDGATLFLTFVNNQFNVLEKVTYYCNVIKQAPMYNTIIIGQNSDRSQIVRGPVFEVMIQGDKFVRGGNLPKLPSEANVFNFAWVPGGSDTGGDYLVVIGDDERMLTFDNGGRRLAKSDDRFSGSSNRIVHDRSLPGLGSNRDDIENFYYVPMRMEVADLGKDTRYEVLVNKPVSTAGMLFNNYRTYPQGEIHAMMWDGIGMELVWKTRRIKGTVVDLTLADADNDGVLDLVVNVNTYPGALGAAKVRAMVILYPLDLTMTDTNAIAPDDDF